MSLNWKHGAPGCVFITGGGSGIGRELAMRLAREGAHIAIINRRPAPAVIEAMRSVALNAQQRFIDYCADVSDETAIRGVMNLAVHELGRPDLVLHGAGIQIAASFDQLAAKDFARVIEVNLVGSRHVAAAALPHLKRGSHLVFVASLAGLVGNHSYAAYSASKFGLVGLAHCLRLELKLRGVDVSVCCPAEINTPLVVEERKTLDPISCALKDFVGTMEVGPACQGLLKGIARRDFEIIPGFMPQLSAFMSRHFPGAMRRVSDHIAARTLRQMRERA